MLKGGGGQSCCRVVVTWEFGVLAMLKWGSLHPFKGGGGVKSVTLSGGGGGGLRAQKGL